MKDYNSIPFKNKAIDRLTRNTTIAPGTQIQEVKVTPSAQQVGNYVTKSNSVNDALIADTEGMIDAANYQKKYTMREIGKETFMKSDLDSFTRARANEFKKNRPSFTSISDANKGLSNSRLNNQNAKKLYDETYRDSERKSIIGKLVKDQSNDKLVDSRTGKDKKMAKKPKVKNSFTNKEKMGLGTILGASAYGVGEMIRATIEDIKLKKKYK